MRQLATLSFAALLLACDPGDDAVAIDDPGVIRSEVLVEDQWVPAEGTAPVYLVGEDGGFFSPVHATLLPDGRVMFLGIPGAGGSTKAALFTPTPLGETPPAALVVDSQPLPLEAQALVIDGWYVDDTPFCGGQTLLADGSLLVAGGTRLFALLSEPLTLMFGLTYAMTWSAATGWSQVADRMKGIAQQGEPMRWYSSTTRLADGRALIMAGRDYVAALYDGTFIDIGNENLTAETFDPVTRTFTQISAYGSTPAGIFNGDYSHVFQLPYDIPWDVMAFGEDAEPILMIPSNPAVWIPRGALRPDTLVDGAGVPIEAPNNGASTAMLPIRLNNGQDGYLNGSVIFAGGTHFRPHESSIDVYDPVVNAWHPRRDMIVRRHHPSTVLLPDGTVLIVAGHDDSTGSTHPLIRKAQIVDPADGFSIAEGSTRMGEVRGYHTISLLLPDGRVLVGGGRTAGPDSVSDEKPTLRYYHPPYLSRPRPNLTWAPATVGYGAGFWVTHDVPITDALLIGLGSMTHSIDMNQRAIQLQIYAQFPGATVLVAPPNAETAPPGHYMLFLLDANRTPSRAMIVQVGT